MEEYIFDGEPHALNEKLGYILTKLDTSDKELELKEEVLKTYKKYAEYLIACDREKAIEYIIRSFRHFLDFDQTPEDTSLVYRPPHVVGPLAQYGTLSLKFKRAPNDTLVNP